MRSGWRATHTVLAVAFGGEGHVDIVRFLLEHGADTEASDCVSNSALLLASHHSHHAIMRLLLDKGSNPDINPDGVTVLYRAVSSGRLESVKYLLSKGATLGIEKVSELDDAWLVDVDVCFDLDAHTGIGPARPVKPRRGSWRKGFLTRSRMPSTPFPSTAGSGRPRCQAVARPHPEVGSQLRGHGLP